MFYRKPFHIGKAFFILSNYEKFNSFSSHYYSFQGMRRKTIAFFKALLKVEKGFFILETLTN